MKKPRNPHDQAFKRLMRQKTFARAFIEQHFSASELCLLKLDTLELWNASFIYRKTNAGTQTLLGTDKAVQGESQSDVVYKVSMVNGADGYILLLFEHQSQAEKMMAFRLLEYSVLLMRQHLDQGHAQLPIVMPVVFYHGRTSPYPYSTDIFDCFEAPTLAQEYYLKPFKLIDVTVIPDEALKQHIMTAPFHLLVKHIRDQDLLPVFKDLADSGILAQYAQLEERKLFVDVLYYAISAGEISNRQAFEALLLEQPNAVRKPFMTILEQYQAEVRQSRQQGIQQGVEILAVKLLADGMALEKVAQLTELPAEKLRQLAANKQPN